MGTLQGVEQAHICPISQEADSRLAGVRRVLAGPPGVAARQRPSPLRWRRANAGERETALAGCYRFFLSILNSVARKRQTR